MTNRRFFTTSGLLLIALLSGCGDTNTSFEPAPAPTTPTVEKNASLNISPTALTIRINDENTTAITATNSDDTLINTIEVNSSDETIAKPFLDSNQVLRVLAGSVDGNATITLKATDNKNNILLKELNVTVTPNIAPQIILSTQTLILNINDTNNSISINLSDDRENKDFNKGIELLQISSSDSIVAEGKIVITQDGKQSILVSGNYAGHAIITVTATDYDGDSNETNLSVYVKDVSTPIILMTSQLTIEKGETSSVPLTVTTQDNHTYDINAIFSNKNIVSIVEPITNPIQIKGEHKGNTIVTITATDKINNQVAVSEINVTVPNSTPIIKAINAQTVTDTMLTISQSIKTTPFLTIDATDEDGDILEYNTIVTLNGTEVLNQRNNEVSSQQLDANQTYDGIVSVSDGEANITAFFKLITTTP